MNITKTSFITYIVVFNCLSIQAGDFPEAPPAAVQQAPAAGGQFVGDLTPAEIRALTPEERQRVQEEAATQLADVEAIGAAFQTALDRHQNEHGPFPGRAPQ